MKFVYGREGCRLEGPDGLSYTVAQDSIWSAEHPIVRKHPWAFSDVPTRVNGEQYHPVEQATAAPGERRRVG